MVKLVGILNITPDSFSDGDLYNKPETALKKLCSLIDEGADIIDLGAESTRPGATPLNAALEKERLTDILPAAINYIKNYNQQNQTNIAISLDSRHGTTIEWALTQGINIINDVSGLENEYILKLAAQSKVPLVIMHNLGIPADRLKIIPIDQNPTQYVVDWMIRKLDTLNKYSIEQHRIIFDPGIGFGKNADQSIAILRNIDQLHKAGLPLFIGHSRKSFLDQLQNNNIELDESRDSKTLKISSYLIGRNVAYLRVHNVREHRKLLSATFPKISEL